MRPNRITCTCENCGTVFERKASRVAASTRLYCSYPCFREDYGTPTERFWRKVDKNGPVPAACPERGPCWLWTGKRKANGYGMIWLDGQDRNVNRFAYVLQVGPLPDDLLVCHHCDNPPCVRGGHFFAGTVADNAADMAMKGRHPTGGPPGERNGRAKLTAGDVDSLRRRYASEAISQLRLATEYGVSESLVQQILSGQVWRDSL